MNSEPIHEPGGMSSPPAPTGPTDRLNDDQRTFAKVVGYALADAWRRRWRSATGSPANLLSPETGPSSRTH